jgi:hypothetical protein
MIYYYLLNIFVLVQNLDGSWICLLNKTEIHVHVIIVIWNPEI